MKTIEQIREFTNQHSVGWLATAEGNQPHVRGVWMWFADEQGFHFHTGTQKRLWVQLTNNPKVEVAFFNSGEDQANIKMVRVAGEVEMVEDPELEERLFQERAWLHGIKAAYPNDRVVIFRVRHGEAQYWDMSVNCREKDQAPIVF